MQTTGDFQIPPPRTGGTDRGSQPAQQHDVTAQSSAATANNSRSDLGDLVSIVDRNGPTVLSGNQIIIGVVASLLLVALFWFVGRSLADTLIKQFAEVSAAKRAGLALTAFLSVVGAAATFGILGNYWLMPYFFAPAGSLSILLFFAFLFSFIGANRSKRK